MNDFVYCPNNNTNWYRSDKPAMALSDTIPYTATEPAAANYPESDCGTISAVGLHAGKIKAHLVVTLDTEEPAPLRWNLGRPHHYSQNRRRRQPDQTTLLFSRLTPSKVSTCGQSQRSQAMKSTVYMTTNAPKATKWLGFSLREFISRLAFLD